MMPKYLCLFLFFSISFSGCMSVSVEPYNESKGEALSSATKADPVQDNYLLQLIDDTESMTSEEKGEWRRLLPKMNDGQKEKLITILETEKVKLVQLDSQYEIEIANLNKKHLKEWEDFTRRDQLRKQQDKKENSGKKELLNSGVLEPEMVDIPGTNNFEMGDLTGNSQADGESILRGMSIHAFRLSKFETTFAEYDAYAKAAGKALPSDNGWGRGNRPVINVSWEDAVAYAKWLSQQTGKRYRLPTEAEWEYAVRAGTETDYSWGNNIDCKRARYGFYDDYCKESTSTVAVGSYAPNKFGLYDMHGNVWEWVQDCYHDSYKAAPVAVLNNGAAWEDNGSQGKCNSGYRVLRGGSWDINPDGVRSANRYRASPTFRNDFYGFRLVQDL